MTRPGGHSTAPGDPSTMVGLREAATRGPETGRRDRAEPLASPTRWIEREDRTMTQVRTSVHLDASIDRVFELATDFRRYPEWNVNYVEVAKVIGPAHKVGTRIEATMKLLDRRLEGWAEITEIDQPRFIKLAGTSKEGGKLSAEYRFTPVGMTTDVVAEIEYELPAGPFGQILDRLFIERTVERDLRHSMENFKALVEVAPPVLV
jgi:uncharacterized membrane protein